jgi:hypothetical protein
MGQRGRAGHTHRLRGSGRGCAVGAHGVGADAECDPSVRPGIAAGAIRSSASCHRVQNRLPILSRGRGAFGDGRHSSDFDVRALPHRELVAVAAAGARSAKPGDGQADSVEPRSCSPRLRVLRSFGARGMRDVSRPRRSDGAGLSGCPPDDAMVCELSSRSRAASPARLRDHDHGLAWRGSRAGARPSSRGDVSCSVADELLDVPSMSI